MIGYAETENYFYTYKIRLCARILLFSTQKFKRILRISRNDFFFHSQKSGRASRRAEFIHKMKGENDNNKNNF